MAESGIDRIAAAFATAKAERRAALMPYLMGGFPDLATSAAVMGPARAVEPESLTAGMASPLAGAA